MSPTLFLVIVSLICVGVFLNGVRFARMDRNPWAGRTMFGQPVSGHDLPIKKVKMLGRIQMIAAPIFFLIFAAMIGGMFGPVDLK